MDYIDILNRYFGINEINQILQKIKSNSAYVSKLKMSVKTTKEACERVKRHSEALHVVYQTTDRFGLGYRIYMRFRLFSEISCSNVGALTFSINGISQSHGRQRVGTYKVRLLRLFLPVTARANLYRIRMRQSERGARQLLL